MCTADDGTYGFDYWTKIGDDCNVEGESCEAADDSLLLKDCTSSGVGNTTIEPCAAPTNTTPCFQPENPDGTCVLKCFDQGEGDAGLWAVLSSDCQNGALCDDILIGSNCNTINETTIAPCSPITTTTTEGPTTTQEPPPCGTCTYSCGIQGYWVETDSNCLAFSNCVCDTYYSSGTAPCDTYGDTITRNCMDTTPEPECKCVHECIQNADGRLRWSYSKADSEVTDGNYCVQYANAECTVLGDTTEEPCTPVDSCICELPDFCPEEDGACTYTRCLSNYGLKGPKIMEECDPASTTTSSTTTTETPCGECTWECGSAEWLPRWVLISENCCEGGDCEDLEGQSCPDYGEFTQTNCTTSTTQGPTTTTTTENVNCCVLEDDSYVLKQVSRLECCRLGGRVVADEQECDDTPTTPECDDTLYACLNSEKQQNANTALCGMGHLLDGS